MQTEYNLIYLDASIDTLGDAVNKGVESDTLRSPVTVQDVDDSHDTSWGTTRHVQLSTGGRLTLSWQISRVSKCVQMTQVV